MSDSIDNNHDRGVIMIDGLASFDRLAQARLKLGGWEGCKQAYIVKCGAFDSG
jgi:hypothetical protein